jgi:hypothetical protein
MEINLNKMKVEITKIMNSTEILNEIKNQLEQLEHKGYDKNSFKSGYLLGYAKALQLQQALISGRFYSNQGLILNRNEMKLFVWKDVLTDYKSGIAFALAENVDEARKLILEKYEKEQSYVSDMLVSDLNAEPLIIENKEGFYVWGGG